MFIDVFLALLAVFNINHVTLYMSSNFTSALSAQSVELLGPPKGGVCYCYIASFSDTKESVIFSAGALHTFTF